MKRLSCVVMAGTMVMSAAVYAESAGHGHMAGGHEIHWGYSGEAGPERWGDLKPEFSMCKSGMHQSPVNIDAPIKADLDPIKFNYPDSMQEILNNGHTVQVKPAAGGEISVGSKKYELVQYHFHTPSEHTINGKSYPMELHLVHKNQEGRLAVVGVLLTPGKANAGLDGVVGDIPQEVNEPKKKEGVKMNLSALLPADASYYHYIGSLTTPPCTEGVNWFVLHAPVEVSQEQINALEGTMHANARPVQPIHHRFELTTK
jgi:carbonic anhydrase